MREMLWSAFHSMARRKRRKRCARLCITSTLESVRRKAHCGVQPVKTEDELAAERLLNVQDQLSRKHCTRILCPYCGHWNFKSARTLCCDTLRKAVIAILSGRRALKVAEAQERANVN